jgi:hypothetical protein
MSTITLDRDEIYAVLSIILEVESLSGAYYLGTEEGGASPDLTGLMTDDGYDMLKKWNIDGQEFTAEEWKTVCRESTTLDVEVDEGIELFTDCMYNMQFEYRDGEMQDEVSNGIEMHHSKALAVMRRIDQNF